MEIREDMVKLDKPTKEIHIYFGSIKKVSQDKLGRVYITLKGHTW